MTFAMTHQTPESLTQGISRVRKLHFSNDSLVRRETQRLRGLQGVVLERSSNNPSSSKIQNWPPQFCSSPVSSAGTTQRLSRHSSVPAVPRPQTRSARIQDSHGMRYCCRLAWFVYDQRRMTARGTRKSTVSATVPRLYSIVNQ
jgi:hypothetical protein